MLIPKPTLIRRVQVLYCTSDGYRVKKHGMIARQPIVSTLYLKRARRRSARRIGFNLRKQLIRARIKKYTKNMNEALPPWNTTHSKLTFDWKNFAYYKKNIFKLIITYHGRLRTMCTPLRLVSFSLLMFWTVCWNVDSARLSSEMQSGRVNSIHTLRVAYDWFYLN